MRADVFRRQLVQRNRFHILKAAVTLTAILRLKHLIELVVNNFLHYVHKSHIHSLISVLLSRALIHYYYIPICSLCQEF